MLCLDKPTIFLNAAWIPYTDDFLKALREATILDPTQGPEYTAIFCHLDIIGAKMNKGTIAKKGTQVGDILQLAKNEVNRLFIWVEFHVHDSGLFSLIIIINNRR